MPYDLVYFEISGICNARCPWCMTGNLSPEQRKAEGYIDVHNFEKAIDRLIELDLIDSSSVIHLYSWGEPLLHPEFEDIARILHDRKLHFAISTNASKRLRINGDLLENLSLMIFSMPGFSQRSYDRISGLSFELVKNNIDEWLSNSGFSDSKGTVRLFYHVYRFNIEEIRKAYKFCQDRRMEFFAAYAYMNDFSLAMQYIEGTMTRGLAEKANEDLVLSYVEDLIKNSPPGFQCPQHDYLSIDQECHVLTCCCLPKTHHEYSIGHLFDLDAHEIHFRKTSRKICNRCLKSGFPYWAHTLMVPDFIDDLISSL